MARDGIVAQQTRVVLWWGRGVHRRQEDFQSAVIAFEIGTHVHGMTSNDVVTRLNAIESCHCVTPVYVSPRTFEAHEGWSPDQPAWSHPRSTRSLAGGLRADEPARPSRTLFPAERALLRARLPRRKRETGFGVSMRDTIDRIKTPLADRHRGRRSSRTREDQRGTCV